MNIKIFLNVGSIFRFKNGPYRTSPPKDPCECLGIFPDRNNLDYHVLVCLTSSGKIHRHTFANVCDMSRYPEESLELL